ncbi:DUF5654 family protein [Candidatus Pacearchaeota archaeon]|nr:DUF5654 family protein [Candidatus Pacearchaeota archaeon]
MNPKNQSHQIIEIIAEELSLLKEEIQNDVTKPVVASFGFIIALVWRDAIQAFLGDVLQQMTFFEKAYMYQFISAIIVTIIVIFIMLAVTRFGRKKRRRKLKEKIKKEIEKENLEKKSLKNKK